MLSIILLLTTFCAGYLLYLRSTIFEHYHVAEPGQQYEHESATKSRHHFKNMIQSLPSKLLPETGKHRHNGRLVIVGDVHGMKDSLVALLSKIDFDRKHDVSISPQIISHNS